MVLLLSNVQYQEHPRISINTEFLSFVSQKYNSYQLSRIDIVFDVYLENTIKASARAKRGAGKRIKVIASTPLPKNWKMLLHVNENKTELFHLIAATIKNYKGNVKIVVTKDNCVLSNFPFEDEIMSPCNHEEADTKMFVHVRSLVLRGHTDITISTVDTDMIVIAISCYEKLARFGLQYLWIEFGHGIHKKWVSIHDLVTNLGSCSRGILFWYTFTGCDTMSGCDGRGKQSAWTTWRVFEDISSLFEKYSSYIEEQELLENEIALIERFTCLMYDKSSILSDVNECRRKLFTKHGRSVDTIPPTKDALLQHTKRAIFRSRYGKDKLLFFF